MNMSFSTPTAAIMPHETIEALITRIKPMMDDIDITSDASDAVMGSYNTAASNGSPPMKWSLKLLVLKERGDIDMEDYLALSREFSKDKTMM